jgi:hypothetical protein
MKTSEPNNAVPGAEPSGTTSTVPGRPWLVRDEHGVFRAASPAAADPAVAVDVEAFEQGIETSYPNASPALRLMAVRTFAAFRRLERAAETSAIRPAGRVPAALREAGGFLDRLVRILESLEATNVKRKGKVDPARAMADLQALIASRKG